MRSLTRRTVVAAGVSAAATLLWPRRTFAAPPAKPWLLFTKSAGFEHDVIKPRDGKPTFLAEHLAPIFAARGLTLIESKDGRRFEPDAIGGHAGFVFYTTGDLTTPGTDGQPPMSVAGKAALLDAVHAGTPFIGLHCATDTFPSPKDGPVDPYAQMLGGAFAAHGEQQRATATIVDAGFPGVGVAADWTFVEEWYALTHLAADLHPIHRLETAGMKGEMYRRDPYPITWTRQHGKGGVFYTALGHREDVIASEAYARLIAGAVGWCGG